MDAGEEIRERIRALNAAWIERRVDDLVALFHPDAVLVAPGFAQRLEGREAVLGSYREFLAAAVVHAFEMDEPEVDVIGRTAVASCPYTMEYELQGGRWRGGGHDLLVWRRDEGEWRVVWRTLVAGPEEEVTPAEREEDS